MDLITSGFYDIPPTSQLLEERCDTQRNIRGEEPALLAKSFSQMRSADDGRKTFAGRRRSDGVSAAGPVDHSDVNRPFDGGN